MGRSFLDAIQADGTLSDEIAAAIRHGGPGGDDGSGLPTGDTWDFGFATGIECSYPRAAGEDGRLIRRDLLAECDHYARFAEDLGLVRDLGLRVLRYGLPYHLVSPAEGRYDWGFADAAMGEIHRLGITPILDLLHFGVPDWVGDFQNPELPLHFARYCGAVAERYPWVRFFTPVNEIYVAAKFSALTGDWNERLKDQRAFVTALKHLVAAYIAGCAAIVLRRPDALFITSESAEFTHDLRPSPPPEAKLENKLLFASLDLLYGKHPDADVALYLLDGGLTRAELDWFMQGEPPGHQVTGNDYYARNERLRLPDGTVVPGHDVLGWYALTKAYYERYRKPVMLTETNVLDADAAPMWLWKQWADVLRMRRDGVPVVGFTWYSLIDQFDWDINLRERRGTVNPCGLYDLDRRPRPVAAAYRELVRTFGRITALPHGEMFELTARPAKLKFDG